MAINHFSARAGQIDAARAAVALIGAPLDEAGRLHAVEQAADRDLGQIEIGGERGLGHAVAARQEGEHPPLRAGDAERLQRPIHGDAAQTRHVVDEKAEPQAGVEIARHVAALSPASAS